MRRPIVTFLCLYFLGASACAPDEGKFDLQLFFPDEVARQATHSVALWVVQPGVFSCAELTADFIDPDVSLNVLASTVIGTEGPQVLPEVPNGRFQFIAEARTADGEPFLRGCSEAVVKRSRSLEVDVSLFWVCSGANEGQACRQNAHCVSGECLCDGGTFGSDCQPCPGGMDNPCYGHGECDEGPAGDGSCECTVGYLGEDCTACAEGFRDGGCGVCVGDQAGVFGGGSGTQADPFWICTVEHIQAIGLSPELWSVSFVLLNDLDLEGVTLVPIGADENPYTGDFDGGGHRLSNLSINLPEQNYVGFFGQTHFGWIHDLHLENCQVSGNEYVGCLAGLLWGPARAESLSATGTVNAVKYAGGLLGLASDMELADLHAESDVQAESMAGCLCGMVNTYLAPSTSLVDSSSSGTVITSGSFDSPGGLVGKVRGPSFMDGCSSDATVEGDNSVGGLVGSATDMVLSNSWATGSVNSSIEWGMNVGGLVGELIDSAVTDCWAEGSVGGDGDLGFGFGGLVGTGQNSSVTACHASGDVSGWYTAGGLVGGGTDVLIGRSWALGNVNATAEQAGGLVGLLTGQVSNCFARGQVHATEGQAGGLVGLMLAGSIERSYSVGAVSGGSLVGGLLGLDDSGGSASVEFAYWDVENSGLGEGDGSPVGSDGGLGYFTAQMKVQSTYEGFVFPDDWVLPADSYPELVAQDPLVIHELSLESADVSGGQFLEIHATGIKAGVTVSAVCDPTTVSIAAVDLIQCTVLPSRYPDRMDLVLLNPDGRSSNRVWFQYTCSSDIFSGSGTETDPYLIQNAEQLENIHCYPAAHFVLSTDLDLSDPGAPEGPINDSNHPFSGVLDGLGNRIISLRINLDSAPDYLGLFSSLGTGALVRNLVIEDPQIVGTADLDRSFSGVLAGYATGAQIENVEILGNWEDAGDHRSLHVGGLLGGCNSVSLVDCRVMGQVGRGQGVTQHAGGLVGMATGCEILRCSFEGSVAGQNHAGGLAGKAVWGEGIRLCRASGNVTAGHWAGGLVGNLQTLVEDSYAQMVVSSVGSSSAHAGGVAGGCCNCTLNRVWASGSLNAPVRGGLIGHPFCMEESSITDAFWDVDLAGLGSDGESDGLGGLGYSTEHMQQQASFPNFDFLTIWLIDEGVDYPRLRWEN